MSDLKELYQSILLDHNKNPRNYGKLEGATHTAEGYSPICGDQIEVSLVLKEGVVEDVRFEASSCAICKASASMMTIELAGQTLEACEERRKQVEALLKGEDGVVDPHSDLRSLSGVAEFSSRIKCAQLPWDTFESALAT